MSDDMSDELSVEVEHRSPLLRGNLIRIIEKVYYTRERRSTTEYITRHVQSLNSTEQPYSRELVFGEDEQPLDLGWISVPAYVLLRNEEGRYSRIPTQAEIDACAKKVLKVRFSDSKFWMEIDPRDSLRLNTAHGRELVVCSASGSINSTLLVIPR